MRTRYKSSTHLIIEIFDIVVAGAIGNTQVSHGEWSVLLVQTPRPHADVGGMVVVDVLLGVIFSKESLVTSLHLVYTVNVPVKNAVKSFLLNIRRDLMIKIELYIASCPFDYEP